MQSSLRLHLSCALALSCGISGAAVVTEPDAVVQNYWRASQRQATALHGSSMEVEIEASLPKLKKHGRLHGLRRISRLGRITYEALHFEGDNTIKNDVIAKYLAAESEAQTDGGASLAVTPANYMFKYNGPADHEGQVAYVFVITPRHKEVGLFKGEIWIDAATYLPVREAGRFVKSPSLFVKRIQFVREFDIQDGISVPRQIHSLVDTRLVGPAELTIDFRNVSLPDAPKGASVIDVGDQ